MNFPPPPPPLFTKLLSMQLLLRKGTNRLLRISGYLAASGSCMPSAADKGWHFLKRPYSTVAVNSSLVCTEVSCPFFCHMQLMFSKCLLFIQFYFLPPHSVYSMNFLPPHQHTCQQLSSTPVYKPVTRYTPHPVVADKEPWLETSCTHLDKKLQYCSSDSCCIQITSMTMNSAQPVPCASLWITKQFPSKIFTHAAATMT